MSREFPSMTALLGLLGGVGAGGLLGGGLGERVDRFTQGGRGETAPSRVDHGPNRGIARQRFGWAI